MKKNYEILKKARDIVKTRWMRGSFGERGGERCAVGAIAEAAGYNSFYRAEYGPIGDILRKAIDEDVNKLTAWNDRSTHKKVLAAFNKAVRLAR